MNVLTEKSLLDNITGRAPVRNWSEVDGKVYCWAYYKKFECNGHMCDKSASHRDKNSSFRYIEFYTDNLSENAMPHPNVPLMAGMEYHPAQEASRYAYASYVEDLWYD